MVEREQTFKPSRVNSEDKSKDKRTIWILWNKWDVRGTISHIQLYKKDVILGNNKKKSAKDENKEILINTKKSTNKKTEDIQRHMAMECIKII